ncbi:MAG TPA: APC family permease [Acidimicrobiales bacterium]|nr:APC family permease [Acidimicrobiales bacterium]
MTDTPTAPPAGMALRRSIGTATATATSAGLAFAAIDYLGVVSVLAYAPGATAVAAILVGGVLVLLVSGIFSELNGLYPSAAGIRLYLGRTVGNRTALAVTFTYMTTVVLVIAADAFLIGAAVRHVLHEPAVLAYVWIAVLLSLATAANLMGVRLAGWVQTVVTYTVLTGTAVLSVVAVFHVGGAFRHPFDLFGKGGFSGVQAIAFALFLYAAFEWVTTTAEEARTPPVITRALFIAPVLIWLASSLFALGLAHLVPYGRLHGSAVPQLLLGQAALGTVGELWMLALTVLTALNTFNGGFLVASRFIYAAAREGNLPRPFARLNLQAVPWLAVTTLAAVSAVVAAIVFATGQWLLLVAVGATIEAAVYAIGSLCVLVLRRRETRERPFRLVAGKPLAVVGIVLFSVLFVATGFSDPKDAHHLSVAPMSVIAVLSLLSTGYVLFVVPRLRAAAAARAAAARPRRRPARPAPDAAGVSVSATSARPSPDVAGRIAAMPPERGDRS